MEYLEIFGAKQNNLKNVNVRIPYNKLVIVTGISGSGKSSLVFDVLAREGQRILFKNFASYIKVGNLANISKPNVDLIRGLKYCICLEQKCEINDKRLTVGSVSHINHFIKLLFKNLSVNSIGELGKDKLFSIHSVREYCKKCHGFGYIKRIDKSTIFNDLNDDFFQSFKFTNVFAFIEPTFKANVLEIFTRHNIQAKTPVCDIPENILNQIIYETNNQDLEEYKCVESIIKESLEKRILANKDFDYEEVLCDGCQGNCFDAPILDYKINNKNIVEYKKFNIANLLKNIKLIKTNNAAEDKLKKYIQDNIEQCNELFKKLGIDYLTFDRPVNELSGGEYQRVRIIAQLRNIKIHGAIYIIDEPSIGLHPKDIDNLIDILYKIKNLNNTVIVVEHNLKIINSGDYFIEIGEESGENGGTIIAEGNKEDYLKFKTVTTDYLLKRKRLEYSSQIHKNINKWLILKDCNLHNLKNITLQIPLGKYICITGVSGSGKSTLITKSLYPAVKNYLSSAKNRNNPNLIGMENINNVNLLSQDDNSANSRSMLAMYINFFKDLRSLFEKLPLAKQLGITAKDLSLNNSSSKYVCAECNGKGYKEIKGNLNSNTSLICSACNGQRYIDELSELNYCGMTIADILNLTVNEAIDLFQYQPTLLKPLNSLAMMNLGYIKLGQYIHTLSGGEIQRMKLALTTFNKRNTGKTLFIIDEPSKGLHINDLYNLMKAINKLVDSGNTVIVIEHNIEMIKIADHIIDIGPLGGDLGGEIIAQGTPQELIDKYHDVSFTAQYLKKSLSNEL